MSPISFGEDTPRVHRHARSTSQKVETRTTPACLFPTPPCPHRAFPPSSAATPCPGPARTHHALRTPRRPTPSGSRPWRACATSRRPGTASACTSGRADGMRKCTAPPRRTRVDQPRAPATRTSASHPRAAAHEWPDDTPPPRASRAFLSLRPTTRAAPRRVGQARTLTLSAEHTFADPYSRPYTRLYLLSRSTPAIRAYIRTYAGACESGTHRPARRGGRPTGHAQPAKRISDAPRPLCPVPSPAWGLQGFQQERTSRIL